MFAARCVFSLLIGRNDINLSSIPSRSIGCYFPLFSAACKITFKTSVGCDIITT